MPEPGPAPDPAVAAVLAEMAAAALPPYTTMSPAAARLANAERNAYWNADPPPVAEVRDIVVPGPARAVPVRLYRPDGAAAPGGVTVYLHGGGWVFGSIATHDGIARRLAIGSGERVLSVDYALAPEHPFPAALDDAAAVVAWLAAAGPDLGIAPDRVALAGDSAGANLALALLLRLRDARVPQPRAAALVYGAFSTDLDTASHRAFGDGRYVLSSEAMRWFWGHYLPEPGRRADPLAAPLLADLHGLPPLLVAAAELDPLRDDSERLAQRLVAAGVDLDWRLWRGMTHASLGWSRRVPRVPGLIAGIGGFLRRRLAAG